MLLVHVKDHLHIRAADSVGAGVLGWSSTTTTEEEQGENNEEFFHGHTVGATRWRMSRACRCQRLLSSFGLFGL